MVKNQLLAALPANDLDRKAVKTTNSNASAAVENGIDQVKDAVKDDSALRSVGRRATSSIM